MREYLEQAINETTLMFAEEEVHAFECAFEDLVDQYEDDSVDELLVRDTIVCHFDNNGVEIYDELLYQLEDAFDRIFNYATELYQEATEIDELENATDESYTDELMRSINMFAELVANDYNGTTHCKTRMCELVDELLAEGYESTEPIKQGDTVITNKQGQHHNVGRVYELTFDNSYIVTFGGIYIAQCYDREELIKIGNAN